MVVSSPSPPERRSAVDILNEAPGGLAFKTAADVAAYLKEERESWDRWQYPHTAVSPEGPDMRGDST